MSLEFKNGDFPPNFRSQKPIVAVDFDGVIHDDYRGYADGSIYGSTINGTYEALSLISKTNDVVIFTAKARPDRPLVGGKSGEVLVWEWLKKKDLANFVSEVTAIKPRAQVYIDDKGIRFEDWTQTLSLLSKLKLV